MEQQLFNLGSSRDPDDVQVVNVQPNVWMLTSEEIPPLLFTIDEAARLLGLSPPTLYRVIRAGDIRSVKVGRCRRISAWALREYAAELDAAS